MLISTYCVNSITGVGAKRESDGKAGTGKAAILLSPRKRGMNHRTSGEKKVRGVDHGAYGKKDHALPVVRYAGRGGGEILRFRVQEFEDRQDQPLWKRGIRGSRQEGGNGHDRGVRNRRAEIPRAERRPAFQVQRGGVVPGAL